MTETERLGYLTTMTGEQDTDILLTYIKVAVESVLNKAYPYGTTLTDVPRQYEMTMLEIACYLINKRGAEGQVSHSENGIARTYESASVPASMLSRVHPSVGVIKNADT